MRTALAAAAGTLLATAISSGFVVAVAVDRGAGEVVIPNGETVFTSGDAVVAMIKHSARAEVCAALVGKAP